MDLSFKTKWLREICECEDTAIENLGVRNTRLLKNRLADIKAASSKYQISVGDPQIINVDNQALFSITLEKDIKVLFIANHNTNPRKKDGELDWNKISRLKVISIGGKNDA